MKRKQENPTRSAMDWLPKVEDSPKEKKLKNASQNRSMDAKSLAPADKAEEIRLSLDPDFPSLVKVMIRSSVSGGFWLGLPSKFCSSNLPNKDTKFTLVDEDEKEYTAKYLPRRLGLSGGWGGFARAHKLAPGDALVLHLVEAKKFKVYIVRAQTSVEIDDDDDVDLQNLVTNAGGSDADGGMDMKKSKQCHPSVLLDEVQREHTLLPGSGNPENHISEEAVIAEFKKINNLESFTVTAKDLAINSEIPEHVRPKYYHLCRSHGQHSFLHKDLVPGLSPKAVAIMITGVVSLADTLRSATIRIAVAEHEGWVNSMKAYKQFGMNVGFMDGRIAEYGELSSRELDIQHSLRFYQGDFI
ncbi:hypothetical protein MKW94_007319 [Papaver nudicaule]|uniref:TF-B3 domain-containing protein n=1 Tax=Papaver nudicaule TaxID=74823 RepID=A0AA41SQ10_PAPNU|nr:hypothetical protein [Papaver nudicaule]